MILVIDVTSNRIIFYTSDTTQSIVLTKNTVIVRYYGEWPAEVTPETCWNWIYVDGTVKHALTYLNQEGLSTIEINRAAFRDSLTDKVTRFASEYPNIDLLKAFDQEIASKGTAGPLVTTLAKSTGDSLENIVAYYKDLYAEYINNLRCVEYVRSRFDKAYSLCNSNSELIYLKNVVDSIKISPRYVDNKDRYLVAVMDQTISLEDISAEISALSQDLWTTESIDSRQESSVIPVIKAVPIPFSGYPENVWDSINIERTPVADLLPATMSMLEDFAASRGESLARVTITKMLENEEVTWAIDIGKYYQNKKRFHLCVSGSYEITVLNKAVIVNPGTLIMIDNNLPHMMQHFGSEDRIAIVFDTEKK